ncbi:MAG: pantetheine-phosphate adenylyltransferase [Prevotellaceae bacterium]|jgi:pantetheine-phosphate adenylyltransferase|nr:pantetheine-phosphate adenylyltransferase [Prevotellaceae bacterium]
MKNIAVFPGTFDPFTIGHYSIVRRALTVFDEIVIAIGRNPNKQNCFSAEQRVMLAEQAFVGNNRVKVMVYDTLTVDLAKELGAKFIVRGIRTVADFEYERSIADANRRMTDIETVLFFTEPEHSFISSSVVRELYNYGKDISIYLPPNVKI